MIPEDNVKKQKNKCDNLVEWLTQCLSCKHSYTKQDDAETVYCRCKNGKCNYEKKGAETDDSKQ